MATAVGMNFKMTASIAKFQASMDKVEEKLKGIERSGKQTARGMKTLTTLEIGRSVLSGLTGLFNIVRGGVSTVTQFASQAADAADKIGKLSSATGMAHEPLQVFTQIASYGGVSSTQFGDALQKMSRGLGEAANGTGTASRGLKQLGLSVDELLTMSPSEQFLKIGSAIGKIEDPTRRSAVAADIFGRSGTKLIPMFADLEKNVDATAKEMISLGQILSGTQVTNIEAMNDSFERVRQTAFKIGTQVLANFAPMITEANTALIEFVKNFQFDGEIGGQALANFLTEAFFEGAEMLAKWGDGFLNALSVMVDKVTKAFEYVFGKEEITSPEIKELKKQLRELGKSFRDNIVERRKGLVSEEQYNSRRKAISDAMQQVQEQIKQEEQKVLTKKREYSTGIGSLTDTVTKARQLYDANSKKASDRADAIATALGKTNRKVEQEAESPAYKALRDEFSRLGDAAGQATPATELFGKNVGLSGEELAQLASDAEKFGPNADLAREALDGMAGAADDATPAAELFGRNVGLSGDALERLALAAEAAQEIDSITDALSPLRDAGALTGQELETLAALVAQSGGKYGELGSALQDLIRTGENLDRVQQSLTDSMMKPAEDFANQRAEMLRRMGFNPFFVEDQKQKWLAQQRDAVERQVEIQREAYEKFKDRLGEGVAENIKDAIGDAVDVESTLPELKTQTSTLSDILTAVKEQILQPVLIPG